MLSLLDNSYIDYMILPPDDAFNKGNDFETLLNGSQLLSTFWALTKATSHQEAISVIKTMSNIIDTKKVDIVNLLINKLKETLGDIDQSKLSKTAESILDLMMNIMAPFCLPHDFGPHKETNTMIFEFAFYTGYEIGSSSDAALAASNITDGLAQADIIKDASDKTFEVIYSFFNAGVFLKNKINTNKLTNFINNLE